MSGDELRRGTLVEATVEKGVYRGRGLARVGGRVVFVPRAHAGDRVRARVTELHAGWAEAALEQVLEPSADRRASPCPYVPRCGGCAYQDYEDGAELLLKQAVLRESLARAGAGWDGEIAVRSSPAEGWRMRAALHFARGEDGLRLGLRQEGTRRVVDVEACLQLSPAMNRAARELHRALQARPALAARVQGLDLLEAPDGRSLVATLETGLDRHEAPGLASLASGVVGLSGFGMSTRSRSLEWLTGSPFVEADVLGVRLRAHAASFFQANRFLLEELARSVVGLVPAGDSRILDLYAGVGLFALPLAARDRCDTVAVEQSPFAAEDARVSARRAGLAGVSVREAAVEQALASLPSPGRERVVLDPPRTGLGRGVVAALAARRPAVVVYVSCDPPTLGRDLALFAARGYRPDVVQLFDLFPKTFHMETVVRLRPAGA